MRQKATNGNNKKKVRKFPTLRQLTIFTMRES